MKIILHADLPLTKINKSKDDSRVRIFDTSITAQVDRGYQEFWARRGMKPPRVAATFVEAVRQPNWE